MARLELTLNFPKHFHIKTFNVKSEPMLSPLAKSILQSVQFKHFYYVRDDIDYRLRSHPMERDFLLQALFSIVISLQNNLSINLYKIIYMIYNFFKEMIKFVIKVLKLLAMHYLNLNN